MCVGGGGGGGGVSHFKLPRDANISPDFVVY